MSAWEILHGDSLALLTEMPSHSVDAVITDPPYSSGGFSRDDKNKDPDTKYTQGGRQGRFPSFGGDNRDQRSYMTWCGLWITQCQRILKPGGYFMAFTDWRQLPVMTDAVQVGGIFWRGLIAWDKGACARAPHKGYFRHQCEYIVWGTSGKTIQADHDGPYPGCIAATVRQADKHHLTGKPTSLMRELVRPVAPGGLILDPFAGSSSTGVAALLEGRRFIGIEKEQAYVDISRQRLQNACADSLRSLTSAQPALFEQ